MKNVFLTFEIPASQKRPQGQEAPFTGIRDTDYAGNFEDFMSEVDAGQPFCFWLGTSEPHLPYEKGSGVATGKNLDDIVVPAIFPDNELVRSDIADYMVEIEHFDSMVARAIESLEKRGLLENTCSALVGGTSWEWACCCLSRPGVYISSGPVRLGEDTCTPQQCNTEVRCDADVPPNRRVNLAR